MIRLVKGEEPDVLRDNGPDWLQAVQAKLAAGEVPTEAEKGRYRHPDIKAAIVKETYGKCAYCESHLLHIAFGDVEHISPKSLKLEDIFRWENLTLACDKCNTYKKNVANLIDPYVDEPDEYFKFLGSMICAIPAQARAVTTSKQLRLNRSELLENRTRRLDSIATILLVIKSTTDEVFRDALIDDLIQNEAGDRGEYAAFVRSFIAAMEPDIWAQGLANA